MREALAVRLVQAERARYENITRVSDLLAKLGPMFGLLGTLIPLGPGIIALGRGDTYTLSLSLLTAFDTTIAGLIAAAAFVISAVRKKWYSGYMQSLEMVMTCVLEVENEKQV
jgi:biopolymer transport protein ExbB/TolQ